MLRDRVRGRSRSVPRKNLDSAVRWGWCTRREIEVEDEIVRRRRPHRDDGGRGGRRSERNQNSEQRIQRRTRSTVHVYPPSRWYLNCMQKSYPQLISRR